jgi:hypothetical protein
MDTDDKTYELPARRARAVPGDGERQRPREPDDPEHLPEKKQPPAHKGLPKEPDTHPGTRPAGVSWSRSRTTESRRPEDDCYAPDGGPVQRGDSGGH